MDPLVLMNDADFKFKSLQEDKLWVTKDPTKAHILAPTTVIGNLSRQLNSKENVNNLINLLAFPPFYCCIRQ